MTLRHITLTYTTTIATQAATELSTQNVLGKLFAILYKPGTTDTNAHVTITCEHETFSHALLALEHPGTADLLYYPREAMHAVANGAALTAANGGDATMPIIHGNLKVVIASGGGTTARIGSVVFYYIV